jgi:modulator of FtsH protease
MNAYPALAVPVHSSRAGRRIDRGVGKLASWQRRPGSDADLPTCELAISSAEDGFEPTRRPGSTNEMSFEQPYLREGALGERAKPVTDARTVFGHTMGLVALTVGFTALGAYIARDMTGSTGLFLFIAAFACLFGLNFAARRSQPLAITLLFAVGLLLGMAAGPVLNAYAQAQPSVLWQSAGATALFVGALGSYGYATSRDLSSWARTLFWLLVGLIVFGIVLIFVNIPGGEMIYAVLGLVLFGAYTIFDFNRLRRANMDSAVPIAAGIFLDIFNIFLFFLTIFGGGRD